MNLIVTIAVVFSFSFCGLAHAQNQTICDPLDVCVKKYIAKHDKKKISVADSTEKAAQICSKELDACVVEWTAEIRTQARAQGPDAARAAESFINAPGFVSEEREGLKAKFIGESILNSRE